MRIDIVTPERQLASTEAANVQIPASEGDMTVMDNHAPMVTTLRPGVVTIDGGDAYVVTGGFAEISPAGASILAERAVPRAEATREMLTVVLHDAKAAMDIATGDIESAAARLRVNDVEELIKHIG